MNYASYLTSPLSPKGFLRNYGMTLLVGVSVLLVSPLSAEDVAQNSNDAPRTDVRQQFLSRSDYSGQDLKNTRFFQSRLNGANFERTNLSQVTFEQCDLGSATFSQSLLSAQTKFFKVNMNDANLQGLALHGASFNAVNLSGANLKNTTGWTSVQSTNFSGADLRGADLSGITELCPDCVWRGAIIDETTRLPQGLDPEKAQFAKP